MATPSHRYLDAQEKVHQEFVELLQAKAYGAVPPEVASKRALELFPQWVTGEGEEGRGEFTHLFQARTADLIDAETLGRRIREIRPQWAEGGAA